MAATCVEITIAAVDPSAVIPPNGANRNTGIWLANPPNQQQSRTGQPVNHHDCATLCIHVPINEIQLSTEEELKVAMPQRRPPPANAIPVQNRSPGSPRVSLDWCLDSDTLPLWMTVIAF